MLPCQDTPAAKSTYTAKITVPAALTALMSARSAGSEEVEGKKVYSFVQEIPIPVSIFS
jgi:leukotriene-A4 hydrolase